MGHHTAPKGLNGVIMTPNTVPLDLTLPIAPRANHRLRNASEETLPRAMVPAEAVIWVKELQKGGKEIRKIDLCGPGDSMSEPRTTLETLEFLQAEKHNAELSVTTVGLGSAQYAKELVRLGVKKLNLMVNTVNPETASSLYAWIRPGKKTLPLDVAIKELLDDQVKTAKSMLEEGIEVVVKTVVKKDINQNETVEIAEKMASLGVKNMEISSNDIDRAGLEEILKQASSYINMSITDELPNTPPPGSPEELDGTKIPKPTKERPNVAVASLSGMEIDMHLGQASQVLIYGPREDGLACLLETRRTPEIGKGAKRWEVFAEKCLYDCFAVLATHAGEAPRKQFAELGIKTFLTDGEIEGIVDVLYGGGKKGKCKRK